MFLLKYNSFEYLIVERNKQVNLGRYTNLRFDGVVSSLLLVFSGSRGLVTTLNILHVGRQGGGDSWASHVINKPCHVTNSYSEAE